MAKFTFLELHLDDATITNNAPYSGAESATEEDAADEAAEDGDRSLLGLVALALVLAVGATVVARALSSGDEAMDELVKEFDQ